MAATCRTIDLLRMGVQPLPSSRQLAGLPALKELCHTFHDDDSSVSTESTKNDSQGPSELLDGTSSYYAGSIVDFTGSLDCSRSLHSSMFASEQSACTEATSFDEFLPKGFTEPPGLERMFNQVPLTGSALLAATLAAAFAPLEVSAPPGLAAPPSAVVRRAHMLQALQVAVPPPPPPPALARDPVVGREPAYISPAMKGMLTVGDDAFAAASAGSLGHPFRCHLPCKFFTKSKRGCKDGSQCNRCHLCKWSKGCEEASSKCAMDGVCL